MRSIKVSDTLTLITYYLVALASKINGLGLDNVGLKPIPATDAAPTRTYLASDGRTALKRFNLAARAWAVSHCEAPARRVVAIHDQYSLLATRGQPGSGSAGARPLASQTRQQQQQARGTH